MSSARQGRIFAEGAIALGHSKPNTQTLKPNTQAPKTRHPDGQSFTLRHSRLENPRDARALITQRSDT